MKRQKKEGRGYWLAVIVLLLAIVVVFGAAIWTGLHQTPSVHPYAQMDFTIPMNDRSDSEIAVYGPETVMEGAL